MSFFFCHYVILSKIAHLSFFVIMSFCLKKHTCLPPSLCYSVFKTTPFVTSVPLLLCLQNYPVSFVFMLLCLKELSCLPPSLCYSVFKTTPSVTPVLLLLCPQNYPVSFVIMSFCLKKCICLAPSPCYSVFKNYPVWLLILLHISCLQSAFLCCIFASSSGMKTVTGWASDDRRG